MSAVDKVLADKCNELTAENERLELQNERLAHLLADSYDILSRFKRDAEDTLRHFGCQRKANGKFDWRKLLDR